MDTRNGDLGRGVKRDILDLRNWKRLKAQLAKLIREVRLSERLTGEDMAVRINVKE